MADVLETCTCGSELNVIGTMRDGTPVTKCPHCDVPLMYQPSHADRDVYCAKCDRPKR